MKVIDGKAVLEGERDFGFRVIVEWPDLLLQSLDGGSVVASYFGGTAEQDPGDNGLTASGARTRNANGTENPIPGYSLPHDPRVPETAGSPIPRLPYHIQIAAFNPANGKRIVASLIDDGPAFGTNHAIDCTRTTFLALGGNFATGLLSVNVRIVDGARHLHAVLLTELRKQGLIPPI
jgi:hypothetical protein